MPIIPAAPRAGASAIARSTGGYSITASGVGSFAQGYATGVNIAASATGAAQFGPGTNALADSLQVGTAGLRFKGTTGAPGTPQNGDHWIASSFVYARSNGVNVRHGSPGAAWTVGTYATRRDFSALTPTIGEVLELLETLVEELQGSNLVN